MSWDGWSHTASGEAVCLSVCPCASEMFRPLRLSLPLGRPLQRTSHTHQAWCALPVYPKLHVWGNACPVYLRIRIPHRRRKQGWLPKWGGPVQLWRVPAGRRGFGPGVSCPLLLITKCSTIFSYFCECGSLQCRPKGRPRRPEGGGRRVSWCSVSPHLCVLGLPLPETAP